MPRAAAPTPARFYRPGGWPPEESVGYLMRRVVASIVHQADGKLGPHGLTSSQWAPLLQLHKAGRSTVAELARCTQVDAGAMTRLLDRLEKKQLCKRTRCTEDRRVVLVDITPQGAAAIAEVPAVLAEVLNAHLAGFSKAEWESLKDYLRRMLDNGQARRHTD